MGGRVYTASIEQVAVTAAQDLFDMAAPSTGMVEILSVFVGQSSDAGDAEAELLPVQITRYASAGSGGTSMTPRPHQVGHAASGVSVNRNVTTQGTTPTVVYSEVFNVQAGWLYQPVPEERIWVPPSGVIAVELPTAPTDSITVSARLTFAEYD